MENLIFGHTWEAIQRTQHGGSLHQRIDTSRAGDYGYDHAGAGMVKMIPSGDVIPLVEGLARLDARKVQP